jgi:hypothetical protein
VFVLFGNGGTAELDNNVQSVNRTCIVPALIFSKSAKQWGNPARWHPRCGDWSVGDAISIRADMWSDVMWAEEDTIFLAASRVIDQCILLFYGEPNGV